ncbi:hypothetical protein C0993_009830 [Termitomyces sp. T159_Od127]|nr:hypothetical protein C0993_009830 [Termitomyces sp. T159_Od127]
MDSKPTEQTKGKVVDNVGEKYIVEDQESASDGVHGGLVFPTEEEKQTLRRVSNTIPWNAYRAHCLSRTGCPGGAGGARNQAGALGKGQRASTGIGTFYQFWSAVTYNQ